MGNIKKLPQMSFGESVKTVIGKLTDFKGRARRSELWWYYLLYFVLNMIITYLLHNYQTVNTVIAFIFKLTLFSVTIRRLHDRGVGGWPVTLAIILDLVGKKYTNQLIKSANPLQTDIISVLLTDPILIAITIVSTILSLAILILCIMDGKPYENKYGVSPKYIEETEENQ